MVVMRTPRIVVGVVVAAVVGVPVAWAPPAGAAPGDLDPTFGTGGRVTTDVAGGSDVALAVVIQPDGRIVVAGISVGASTREDIVLARYSTDGTLDASFGVGGLVVTDVAGSEDDGFALVQQRDGKLVVAGTTFDQAGDSQFNFALARYDADGALDPTFGAGGLVTTDFAGFSDEAFALALQPDGKLVAAGDATNSAVPVNGLDFALARYTPDGNLDPSFGTGGRVTTDFGVGIDTAHGLVLRADGGIVAGGTVSTPQSFDFGLAAYTATGALDPGFGTGGLTISDFGDGDVLRSLALQPDGRIVAAGESDDLAEERQDVAVARYTPDGTLDPGFGAGGVEISRLGADSSTANAVALAPDGNVVVAGFSSGGMVIARYRPDGTLDPGFVTAGFTVVGFSGGNASALAVAIQPDGAIVAAGGADEPDSDIALARLLGDGLACTITGTPGHDTLPGTPGDDVICGLGGDDTLVGGPGDDTLVGGPGADRLLGGPGDDRIDGVDGVAGNDRLLGGQGRDDCTADAGDDVRQCP
jgi:uncharacterized delta-60 repeat protein